MTTCPSGVNYMHLVDQTRVLANRKHIELAFSTDQELGYEMMRRFMGIIVERLEATSLQLLDIYGDHD